MGFGGMGRVGGMCFSGHLISLFFFLACFGHFYRSGRNLQGYDLHAIVQMAVSPFGWVVSKLHSILTAVTPEQKSIIFNVFIYI